MDAHEWVRRFAEEIGAEAPTEEEFGALLDLAATAAHDSERIAAPVACWVAGRTGKDLDELREVAEGVGGGGAAGD